MSDISIFGAGAFGTALAISLATGGRQVSLVTRNPDHAQTMNAARENTKYLAGCPFPPNLQISADSSDPAPVCLIAVPMQKLAGFFDENTGVFAGKTIVACCKGVDLATGHGPTALIDKACPNSTSAILSGPSFAIDIAAGLPTALTVASADAQTGVALQSLLSNSNLRLYSSTDVTGVELGGALKNVMAIAAGVTIGAGLGESARAAIMTRGFAEMQRFAFLLGAAPETLAGLSGFGDLVLTCTSAKSRNYSFGLDVGAGRTPRTGVTVEGAATAKAVSNLGEIHNIDLPVSNAVVALLDHKITVSQAVGTLLSRPLRKE